MANVIIQSWSETYFAQGKELLRQLGYELTDVAIRHNLALIDDSPHDWIYLAVAKGQAVGLMHVKRQFQIHTPVRLEVVALVVDEAYRGSGVGKILLNQADKMAREMDLPEIVLHSSQKRVEAHRFYLNNGYQNVKTSYWFSRNP